MLIGINDKLCESASSKRLDYLTGLEIIHTETKGGLERALGFVHVFLGCRARPVGTLLTTATYLFGEQQVPLQFPV